MAARYKPSPEEDAMYSAPSTDVKPPAGGPEGGEEGGEKKSADTVDEQESTSTSAVIPNKVLTGPDGEAPKEGDEIVLKVVKNYGDESEVVYAPAKPKPGTETPGEPLGSDAEIEALDQKA